ncbi:MAG: L,D-transpeptidase [Nocardioidaceae bacterium]
MTIQRRGATGSSTTSPLRSGTSAASSGSTGSDSTTSADAEPQLPAHSGSGRRAVFDMTDQRVWLVAASGKVVRTYLVSGSKTDNVKPGTYQVYARELHTISYNDKDTMNYMVSFTTGEHYPIGFHDIPVSRASGALLETRKQLGSPQSAGCIRQWEPDAKAMWTFAPIGTTVVVLA